MRLCWTTFRFNTNIVLKHNFIGHDHEKLIHSFMLFSESRKIYTSIQLSTAIKSVTKSPYSQVKGNTEGNIQSAVFKIMKIMKIMKNSVRQYTLSHDFICRKSDIPGNVHSALANSYVKPGTWALAISFEIVKSAFVLLFNFFRGPPRKSIHLTQLTYQF